MTIFFLWSLNFRDAFFMVKTSPRRMSKSFRINQCTLQSRVVVRRESWSWKCFVFWRETFCSKLNLLHFIRFFDENIVWWKKKRFDEVHTAFFDSFSNKKLHIHTTKKLIKLDFQNCVSLRKNINKKSKRLKVKWMKLIEGSV